jgi:hypothetical protein
LDPYSGFSAMPEIEVDDIEYPENQENTKYPEVGKNVEYVGSE